MNSSLRGRLYLITYTKMRDERNSARGPECRAVDSLADSRIDWRTLDPCKPGKFHKDATAEKSGNRAVGGGCGRSGGVLAQLSPLLFGKRKSLDGAARQTPEAMAYGGSYVSLGAGVTHFELAWAAGCANRGAGARLLCTVLHLGSHIQRAHRRGLSRAALRILRARMVPTAPACDTTPNFLTGNFCNCWTHSAFAARWTLWARPWAARSP